MPLRYILIFILLLLPAAGSGATPYTYEYTANCDKAYQCYLALHLQEARAYIAAETSANPNNLMPVYLADYEDCILLLLNCSRADYDQRAAHLDERLRQLNKGSSNAPWHRLCKAGIYLHWAIVNIRFGDNYKAAINFHKSFALLHENQELFPSFEYNNVFAGLQEAVVGSLPGSYKWLASIFGMKGSIKNGTGKLSAFVSTHNASQPLYTETVLYYIYARFYLLAEQKEVWNFLSSPQFPVHNNLLATFAKANIALDYRRAEDAIAILQASTTDPDYHKYPLLDYQYGAALLSRLDTAAVIKLQQYLATNKSDIYIKDAWQKMAYAWYVNGNMAKARYCIEQAGIKGSTRIDADKQANRHAKEDTWPLMPLLQARLLIEGGYYTRALAILQHINQAALTSPADKAEYNFRLGRTYEELAAAGNGKQYYPLAFAQYRTAIAMGSGRHEQFAARAALHMGKMYEQLGMTPEAIDKYKECLDMPSHDFQNTIDQQAKAGINRVEGR